MCGILKLKARKRYTEIRELFGLEPISLVVKKGRLKWFGHVECKNDASWVKH